MTRTICKRCNGTGRETCPIHGSHVCGGCNGRGCVGNLINFDRYREIDWMDNGIWKKFRIET